MFTTLLNALTTAVCEIEDEFILDRFNLSAATLPHASLTRAAGLNSEVHHYAQALDVITDNMEDDLNDELRDGIESSARHLYGLIHARFILTSRGLSKMVDKFRKADFGRCPRVLCYGQALLPVGLSDIPYQKAVKLYCPRCEDIYSPKSTRHGAIECVRVLRSALMQSSGAYFGSTFPHMLFMVYPNLCVTRVGRRCEFELLARPRYANGFWVTDALTRPGYRPRACRRARAGSARSQGRADRRASARARRAATRRPRRARNRAVRRRHRKRSVIGHGAPSPRQRRSLTRRAACSASSCGRRRGCSGGRRRIATARSRGWRGWRRTGRSTRRIAATLYSACSQGHDIMGQ